MLLLNEPAWAFQNTPRYALCIFHPLVSLEWTLLIFFLCETLFVTGIAYRGRLLIEVNTKILNNTDIMDETTENGEINRIPQLASVSFEL